MEDFLLLFMCFLGIIVIFSVLFINNTTIKAQKILPHPQPQAAFSGVNYSGIYDCIGQDNSEGTYKGKVTLNLMKEENPGEYGAYNFKLEVPGFGAYPGYAAAKDNHMAIYFANTDPSNKDFGVGIANFAKNDAGKWSFQKYYYEPEFKGGNFGIETCTAR
jgi:hypothetical protein